MSPLALYAFALGLLIGLACVPLAERWGDRLHQRQLALVTPIHIERLNP